ncbi:hypothetical protein IAT38_002084 [Cryptococcus sp. DSM 104549]
MVPAPVLIILSIVEILRYFPVASAFGIQNYPNLFFTPEHVLDNAWFHSIRSKWSREMCQHWADDLIEKGPWSVTNKTLVAASGDPRDYLSYAVYFWPDCSSVGNTTELTDEEIYAQCVYKQRDGIFNPDIYQIHNAVDLIDMSNSIYLSTLAYVHTNDTKYSNHVNHALHTWFVNNQTKMNPNLDYAQVVRGPGSGMGKHTGVLDMTVMAKIVSGVMIMRELRPAEYLQETDDGLVEWIKAQIVWLETSPIALEEKASVNNHGTFYYNQISALYAFIGQPERAREYLEEFYSTIYLGQIHADGDEIYESVRTRPYHYRAYNLMALLTNARIADFVGLDPPAWERRTSVNTTMADGLHFAMAQDPYATDEGNQIKQLSPVVAAFASKYGDPTGRYAAFLKQMDPYYPGQPWFALTENVPDSEIRWGPLEQTFGPVPAQPTMGAAWVNDRKKREWRPRGAGPMATGRLSV